MRPQCTVDPRSSLTGGIPWGATQRQDCSGSREQPVAQAFAEAGGGGVAQGSHNPLPHAFACPPTTCNRPSNRQ